jgi:hypothetical protein
LNAKPCDPYRVNKGNNVCKEKMLEKGNMMMKKEKKDIGKKEHDSTFLK